ncbi:hypothetical protein KIN20_007014, partial [Parelaphostrongylus tenuis]
MAILIWPINQDPEDCVKFIEKQSLKLLKKIRLCQPVIWPMISNVQTSRSERFWKMQARNGKKKEMEMLFDTFDDFKKLNFEFLDQVQKHSWRPISNFVCTEERQLSMLKEFNLIAVIIPFRDREAHLKILLNYMHSMLTKQKLDYSIIVVEPVDQTFNRAKLFNVGFVEALKIYDWQCFLFHDVDLIPEDDRNLHYCPLKNPRHMAVAVNKFDYKLIYARTFGGSSALTVKQFRKVNGFSNRYWGWGGEDDDMYN